MAIKFNQIEDKPQVPSSQTVPPTTGPDKGAFYPKTIGGITEGVYIDSSGREIQLTQDGAVKGGGSGGGESNTASNLGTGTDGEGLFSTKVGVDLRFKRIKAGTNITLTSEANDVVIAASGGGSGEANTASSLGTITNGESLVATKVGVDLQFKRIKAGTNVSLTSETNDVLINVPSVGETNTASNVGTGEGSVFKQKSAADLQFRKIKAGTNVTVTQGTCLYSLKLKVNSCLLYTSEAETVEL